MDRAKKAAEELILKRFVSNKDLGLIISSIQALDPPDFKMKRYSNGGFKTIGVELTRVINPSLKQHESSQDAVVRMAHENFKATLNENLVVYVYFSKVALALNPSALKSLANSLVNIVTDVALKNKGFSFSITTDGIELPAEFEKITIETDDGFENWQPFGSFVVPYVDPNWFGNIITKKEVKISGYKETFDEKWLILVANFGHASSHFQFTNLRLSLANSPFDRIFIYLFRDDVIVRLKDDSSNELK